MEKRLIDLALACGADKATVINADDIVLSRIFRDICATNACGGYGRCWMCPPDVGDIETLMEMVCSYKHALVFQTITLLEDSYDIENMSLAGKNLSALCLRLREQVKDVLPAEHLVLGAGGCRVCEKCAKQEGLSCVRPSDALMSLEACGIDVYNTVKDTELKYTNGANTVTFFGMVLYN